MGRKVVVIDYAASFAGDALVVVGNRGFAFNWSPWMHGGRKSGKQKRNQKKKGKWRRWGYICESLIDNGYLSQHYDFCSDTKVFVATLWKEFLQRILSATIDATIEAAANSAYKILFRACD